MAKKTKEESEQTRNALLDAARKLFVEKGYADTATPEIATAAGVTRGALYHHFEDKRALFEAVITREGQAVGRAIEEGSAPGKSVRDALLYGASAYFDAMAVPGRTRLLLVATPAVIGVGNFSIDEDCAEASLREGVVAYLRAENADESLADPMTFLLSAAFDRAALAIDAGADRASYERAIAALLDGMVLALR